MTDPRDSADLLAEALELSEDEREGLGLAPGASPSDEDLAFLEALARYAELPGDLEAPLSPAAEAALSAAVRRGATPAWVGWARKATPYLSAAALLLAVSAGMVTVFGDNIRKTFGASADALAGDDMRRVQTSKSKGVRYGAPTPAGFGGTPTSGFAQHRSEGQHRRGEQPLAEQDPAPEGEAGELKELPDESALMAGGRGVSAPEGGSAHLGLAGAMTTGAAAEDAPYAGERLPKLLSLDLKLSPQGVLVRGEFPLPRVAEPGARLTLPLAHGARLTQLGLRSTEGTWRAGAPSRAPFILALIGPGDLTFPDGLPPSLQGGTLSFEALLPPGNQSTRVAGFAFNFDPARGLDSLRLAGRPLQLGPQRLLIAGAALSVEVSAGTLLDEPAALEVERGRLSLPFVGWDGP